MITPTEHHYNTHRKAHPDALSKYGRVHDNTCMLHRELVDTLTALSVSPDQCYMVHVVSLGVITWCVLFLRPVLLEHSHVKSKSLPEENMLLPGVYPIHT